MVLFSIFFSLLLVVYYRLERRIVNKDRTPFFFTILITIPVTILYCLTSNYLYYHEMVVDTVFYLLLGYVIFILPGFFFISHIKRKVIPSRTLYGGDFFNDKLLMIIAYALSFIMILRAYSMGFNYTDGDVATEFAGKGLFGHILVIQMFLETHFLISVKKNEVSKMLLIILLSACTLFYNVKVWIFAPYIIAFLVRSQFYNFKISLVKLLIVTGVVFGFFILSYLPSFDYELNETQWIFIVDHFTKYVYAGISGMNEAFRLHLPMGQNPAYGIPPFIQLFLNFNYKADSNYDYLVVNDMNGEYTNVYTLFGGGFLFNGIVLGSLYIYILSFVSYYFYYQQRKTSNYWFILSYYFWCLGLLFSFFSNYYTLLNVYELALYGLIMGFICKKKVKAYSH